MVNFENMTTGYFTVTPLVGEGCFTVKVVIPETGDFEQVEEYMDAWFNMNMRNIDNWEIIDTSLFEGASNDWMIVKFKEDTFGNEYYLYIDRYIVEEENGVDNIILRHSSATHYTVIDSIYSLKEEDIDYNFTNEELNILSDALINLIRTVNEAKLLIPDKKCQEEITNNIKKYTKLNCKVCSLMTED